MNFEGPFMFGEEVKLAKELKRGDIFSWKGSFGRYTALTDAMPDPSYPGKVVLKTDRKRVLETRLDEDCVCEMADFAHNFIQYPIDVTNLRFYGKVFREGLKTGKHVKIRSCRKDEPGTHLGIYLGDAATGTTVSYHKDGTLDFYVGYHNPAIWVPALGRIVYGMESWWGIIEDPDKISEITDEKIQDVWYVKYLHLMSLKACLKDATMSIKEKKAKLAKILEDPAKRPLLAEILEGQEDGLKLVKSMKKDYPDEVAEVLALLKKAGTAKKKAGTAKKTTKKKTVAKKKTTKRKTSKKV